MPFAVAERDGVLTLTLDTPGSPINIFNHATARQLVEILAAVTPATTRAIVFETAKPNSFINGVGLLLAQAARTREDSLRASAPPWTAYRAVRDAPVPTVAVMQGNCFGCGVEFALNCDYRIASRQLRDPVLHDRAQRLPVHPAVRRHLESAGRPSVWRTRSTCCSGANGGAAQPPTSAASSTSVAPPRAARRAHARLRRTGAGGRAAEPSARAGRWGADEDLALARTRRRIAALPPQYRPVYDRRPRAARSRGAADATATSSTSAASCAAPPPAPLADGQGGLRRSSTCARWRASAPPGGCAAPRRRSTLRRRRRARPTRRVRSSTTSAARAPGNRVRRQRVPRSVWSAPRAASPVARTDAAPTSPSSVVPAADAPARPELYAPTYGGGGRLIELAIRVRRSRRSTAAAPRLARALQRFGFEVARTHPGATLRLATACCSPISRRSLRFVELGGDAAVVEAALRGAGFVRLPRDLLAALDRGAARRHAERGARTRSVAVAPLLAALASDRDGDGDGDGDGTDRAVIADGLALSLLDAVLTARAAPRGARPQHRRPDRARAARLPAPSLQPLHLAQDASASRARSTTTRALRALVPHAALDTARAFVAAGRELYR